MIAPLTLQLLAENAVKHNAISSETPLTIELEIMGKLLAVKNNLNPKVSSEKGAGMGLENILKRYELLTKEEVIITKREDSFIVYIPLLKVNIEGSIDYRRRRSCVPKTKKIDIGGITGGKHFAGHC